jgi:hypothetical protein
VFVGPHCIVGGDDKRERNIYIYNISIHTSTAIQCLVLIGVRDLLDLVGLWPFWTR